MTCLPKIYLSWKMRVWVTHIFSWFSYGAASCGLQVTLLFIPSLSTHLLQWECWGKGDGEEVLLEAVLPYCIFVCSLGCSHKLFFSSYSDHRSCPTVLLVRWNCRFQKCVPGFTQFDQKRWKWKKQKFTIPQRKQSRRAFELALTLNLWLLPCWSGAEKTDSVFANWTQWARWTVGVSSAKTDLMPPKSPNKGNSNVLLHHIV